MKPGKLFSVILVSAVWLGLSACHHQAQQRTAQFDGRSQQAFFASLAAMQAQLSPEQFQRVVWAIGYLQVHDLQPLTLDDFYASLDGASANTVVARAETLQQVQP